MSAARELREVRELLDGAAFLVRAIDDAIHDGRLFDASFFATELWQRAAPELRVAIARERQRAQDRRAGRTD
jgi:hypothetical protein